MAVKVKNELKIGILVVVAIVMFVLGLNFLKGKSIFSSENEYYTYYDNVQGLQESASVQLSGLAIGRVSGIELQKDKRIKVIFTLDKQVRIPTGSFAKLASADLISGTKIITLELADSTTGILKDGSFVQGKDFTGLLDNLSENVSPLVSSLQHTIVTVDTLVNSVNSLFNEETRRHLNQSMVSLDVALKQLAGLAASLNSQSKNLSGVIENANSITSNLANSNEKISNTLTNLETFSNTLSKAEMDKTLNSLQAAAAGLQGIVVKVNDNQGSIGMMLSDKQLYNNLTETLATLDILLADLKSHPAKYINVSVFGRKVKQQ
jgi:phospholipid/cholesterol/gamma-HCH transport system substrate-binding protein